MSIEPVPPNAANPGFPELTGLGKRIEVLRIQRGLSKQQLARGAGASRQQLWRVATGKSDLTPALRQRLADVLGVDVGELRAFPTASYDRRTAAGGPRGVAERATDRARGGHAGPFAAAGASSLAAFVADPRAIIVALEALPGGSDGLRLKRALLDAIEDLALDGGLVLDADFFDVRRRVLNGEL